MKVVFFSESQINGKIPREFPNTRTEYAWMMALDAPHYNINNIPNEKFDLGIVIIPKDNPNIDLDLFKSCCDKVTTMQEGPHWFFQDYSVEQQFHYYNVVVSAGGNYGSSPDYSSITIPVCIPKGELSFTILDTYGDGLNGALWQGQNGSYYVKQCNDTLVYGIDPSSKKFAKFSF